MQSTRVAILAAVSSFPIDNRVRVPRWIRSEEHARAAEASGCDNIGNVRGRLVSGALATAPQLRGAPLNRKSSFPEPPLWQRCRLA